MSPRRPPFRTKAYGTWTPPHSSRLARVWIWPIWHTGDSPADGSPIPTLLAADDLTVSVLPRSVLEAHDVHVDPLPGEAPSWRGIPCHFGLARLSLICEMEDRFLPLSVLVRVPEERAQPEPQFALLGNEFLVRHGAVLTVDYGRFPPRGQRPDGLCAVGWLDVHPAL
jgi:hypothetical protein